jgi:GntR family transcriptional regulator, transcriptional repressor for pyruvate dehydrogenase complex
MAKVSNKISAKQKNMHAKNQQPYKQVVGALSLKIFFNHVKPGTKLPTERQLAQELGVDRSSLRVGLKHLEAMKVLDIRQGDGIYVKDYLKCAGIEFISTLFEHLEQGLPHTAIDEYIIDEIWEFWIGMMYEILALAIQRFTSRNAKALMDIFEEELAGITDREKVIECELASQEFVAETANNMMYLLLSNTSRPLRRKMIELFIYSADEETIREHIEAKRELVRKVMLMEDRTPVAELYRQHLKSIRTKVRGLHFSRD